MSRIARLALKGMLDLSPSPMSRLTALVAAALTAFLAGMFLLLIANLELAASRSGGHTVFQTYWSPEADMQLVREQWATLEKVDGLVDIATYSPDQALAELSKALPHGLKGERRERLMADNPLPPTAVLTIAPQADGSDRSLDFLERLRRLPGVEEVRYDLLKTDSAGSWASVGRRVFLPLIFLLLCGSGFIIAGALKLAMAAKREEVDILRLVGAPWWYIRLPLMVGGAFQAFLAGAAGLAGLRLTYGVFAELLRQPPFLFDPVFLSEPQAFGLVGALCVIGALAGLPLARE